MNTYDITVRTDKSIKLILFRDSGQFKGFSGSSGPSQSTISGSSLWLFLSISESDGMVVLTVCCKERLLSIILKLAVGQTGLHIIKLLLRQVLRVEIILREHWHSLLILDAEY